MHIAHCTFGSKPESYWEPFGFPESFDQQPVIPLLNPFRKISLSGPSFITEALAMSSGC